MVHIKQPPSEAEELRGYLSALAPELNRAFLAIEERLNDAAISAADISARLYSLTERVEALGDE